MKTMETKPLRTVLTISVGFIVLYYITNWPWTLQAALLVGLAGIFSKYLSAKIDYVWMKLAWFLSLIMQNVLLGIIFFFLLFPIALLSKLFDKKDPLNLKNKSGSNFRNVNKEFNKTSFEKTC
jgi:hypothetical protein